MQDAEHLDGLLGGGLMAVHGNSLINDFLHALANLTSIFKRHRMTNVQVHIVAVGNRNVDSHLALLIQVVDGFAEHEEKRAGVGAESRRRSNVKKLHILAFIDAVVHAFHLVIDMGTDRPVKQRETCLVVQFFERTANGNLIVLSIVLAANANSLFHKELVDFIVQCLRSFYIVNERMAHVN